MTLIKTAAALSLVLFLAACAGADTMSFASADMHALNNIPTTAVAPLY